MQDNSRGLLASNNQNLSTMLLFYANQQTRTLESNGSFGHTELHSHRTATNNPPKKFATMKTVAEYRERAEECRRMANRALPKHHNALIKMAQVMGNSCA
jgi:hypothetical protein